MFALPGMPCLLPSIWGPPGSPQQEVQITPPGHSDFVVYCYLLLQHLPQSITLIPCQGSILFFIISQKRLSLCVEKTDNPLVFVEYSPS